MIVLQSLVLFSWAQEFWLFSQSNFLSSSLRPSLRLLQTHTPDVTPEMPAFCLFLFPENWWERRLRIYNLIKTVQIGTSNKRLAVTLFIEVLLEVAFRLRVRVILNWLELQIIVLIINLDLRRSLSFSILLRDALLFKLFDNAQHFFRALLNFFRAHLGLHNLICVYLLIIIIFQLLNQGQRIEPVALKYPVL